MSPKYEKLCAEAVRSARGEEGTVSSRNVYDTLRKILPEAEKRGLKLGCENRQALEEIPLESDFQFCSASWTARTWFTGTIAATRKSRKTSASSITRCIWNRSRRGWPDFTFTTCNFPARDHAAPGTGTIDFAALKPFVKPEHIKVFELSPSLPVEAVKGGIAHVKAIWGAE